MSTSRSIFIGILVGLLIGTIFGSALERREHIPGARGFKVEAFAADITITIQCSGDCDLAAMIAEAREAAEK